MSREIGSFIELAFESGKEYYAQDKNIARLNSGRASIYHAVRLLNCKTAYLPIYQCETVREFLLQKGVIVKYYNMDRQFTPLIETIGEDACIILVNYFGIMSTERMGIQRVFCAQVRGSSRWSLCNWKRSRDFY